MNIGKEGKAFVAEPIETPDVEERTADAPERVEELVPVAVSVQAQPEREAVTA